MECSIALTHPHDDFGVADIRLAAQWVRHRCQLAPSRVAVIAATNPEWASLVTSLTPDRPRAFRPRNRVSQPASDSAEQMSMPRISRCPSALTPVATKTWVFTTRPPSRTFIVNASAATNVYGP